MSACKKCLLPKAVPGSDFNSDQVCSHCSVTSVSNGVEEIQRQFYRQNLEATLRQCRGRSEYDCIVCLSGGKDSVYLLHKLKVEYGLKVLAFTTRINLPDVAWRNIERAVEKLGVDHMVYVPPKDFYKKFFIYLLKHQEERGAVRTVCYVCAPLFEAHALAAAVEKGIGLVFAGYSPGQPEPDRMVYEMKRSLIEDTDWTPSVIRDSGEFTTDELARFWNPKRYPQGTQFPRFIAPFHAWEYSQADVMKKVVELGLIQNSAHASPVHSNCPVNWLLMYSDLKNLGYNPYAPEFSKLIREGKANRAYWKIMGPIVDFMIRHRIFLGRNVTTSLKWLGLQVDELSITRSKENNNEK